MTFTPLTSKDIDRYCGACRAVRRKRSCENSARHRAATGKIKKPGVGKGGNNAKGSEDGQYQTGIAKFQNTRYSIKEKRRYCNRCDKDLIDASRYHWCLHHIDHDRANNTDENFELLCERCHQMEHECHKAFESVETIRKGVGV